MKRLIATVAMLAMAVPVAAQDARTGVARIYDKALGDGWQNWSWAKTELSVAVQGSQRTPIRVDAGPYQALYLHHDAFDTTPYTTVSMLIQGTGGGGQKVRVVTIVAGKPLDTQGHVVTLPPAGWTKVDLPLTTIGAAGKQIDGFWVQNATDHPIAPFYVTEIALR
ncbi:hypothetical protein [Sphingomonas sp. CFBP 13720]|uniref:hypothetical protein n=1 Tax=Sphingomonas sp. CFBP 13720 TaxID=2775302 RepID=UPI00177E2758|nr:hypothetical protein [Sphingomonas sp. CFBP 13720]MBD8677816.1 hypothetical protein [Sphingomonas sp. CFBP 13720]